jgi:hypothetical protein
VKRIGGYFEHLRNNATPSMTMASRSSRNSRKPSFRHYVIAICGTVWAAKLERLRKNDMHGASSDKSLSAFIGVCW